MERVIVEVRTAAQHLLCERHYFATLDGAIEFIEDEQEDDFKNGESDEYEYEIINHNKKGGTRQ